MPSIHDDFDNFCQFAADRLASGDHALLLVDLFREWHDRCQRQETNQAIRRGLADIEAGRYQAAGRAMEMIRRKHGFAQGQGL